MSDFSVREGHLVYPDELEQRIAAVLPDIVVFERLNKNQELETFRKDELLQVLVGGLKSLPENRIEHFRRGLLRRALRLAKVDAYVTNVILRYGLQGLSDDVAPFIVAHTGYVVTQRYYNEGKRRLAERERLAAATNELTKETENV